MFLTASLDQLEVNIVHLAKTSKSVSEKPIGWHLDHSLKVINGIYEALRQSDPSEYVYSFNFMRLLVFTTGHIPRGKGKAPKKTIPTDAIDAETLHKQLRMSRIVAKKIDSLPAHSHFTHPVFGMLHLKHAKKMLEIHSKHHLRIIADIHASTP